MGEEMLGKSKKQRGRGLGGTKKQLIDNFKIRRASVEWVRRKREVGEEVEG